MSNWLILVILVVLLFPGTKKENFRILSKEVPWWFLVIIGFTISVVGLLTFNDDRIVFLGCFILTIAKIYSMLDEKHWEQNEKGKS